MDMYGWGRYPRTESNVVFPRSIADCQHVISQKNQLIVRGMGRSYGDSSLGADIMETRYLNCFEAFDNATGLLSCESGVTLAEILEVFVPRGWFLPVTPGTRFVSVGGAIAGDVHGKNHHMDGTFTEHVSQIRLLLGNGEQVVASPTQNVDLFRATCGGMGLTGVILSATIKLKPISSSNIVVSTMRLSCLGAALDAFAQYGQSQYSVAWIDCLAKNKNLGRSVLMIGEHADDGILNATSSKSISIPFDMPSRLLNPFTMSAFNTIHYGMTQLNTKRISYEQFFYPLDKFSNWNRLYGTPGFIQYQFVLPKESGERGLRAVLELIVKSGKGSFLAVLKVFGKGNQNYLSFPASGYTLALDFKVEPAIFLLFDELDRLILEFGGRHYLCKDARMTEQTFKGSYPLWQEFENTREKYHAIGKFASLQSKRLGLQ